MIFLDPFSPPSCPQLWTTEFLKLVAESLNPNDGVLVTYSCAAAVRAALKSAGLAIGSVQSVARKWPGTVACHSASRLETSLPPLSQQEKEHLLTKAAIPYRDPTLQSTAEEILKRRVQEQSISPLRDVRLNKVPVHPAFDYAQPRFQLCIFGTLFLSESLMLLTFCVIAILYWSLKHISLAVMLYWRSLECRI